MDETQMYELTAPQNSIWLTEQYFSDTPINNICGSVIIKQEIKLDLLNKSINIFIQNNDSFKLRFKNDNGKLMQYMTKDSFFNFEILELNQYNQVKELAKKEANTKIDLLNSRPFNFKLFKLSNGFGGYIIKCHHIISDAATLSILCSEISDNYSKLLKNQQITKKANSYIDYIHQEKEYLQSERFIKDKEFWGKNLENLPEIATFLPQKNTESEKINSKREEFILHSNLLKKINTYCSKNKISTFNFLIGIYSLYLGQINNMEKFLIGTPILNRITPAEKNTSGMFINTSLLKIDISDNITFTEYIKKIATDSFGVLRHQRYNYQYILNDLRKLDSSVPNLYDVMFSYQVTKATNTNLDIPYSTHWYETEYISNSLNIHFHDNDSTENLLCEYDYQVPKIQKKEITKMHNRILNIIDQVLLDENIFIHNIDIITPDEKNEILNTFNTNKIPYSKDKDLIQIFKEQVKSTPDATALFFDEVKISYSKLDKLSDILANYLSTFNIQKEDKIAIFLDKSIEMIVSILAILKVHATFIPIDIQYPQDRIRYILEDSNVKIAITSNELNPKIESKCTKICIDNIDFEKSKKFNYTPNTINSLAYIMYTSGSTGKPKGVMIEQKSILRLAIKPNFIKLKKNERILQTGSIVFDACTFEIWAALLNGLKLYILTKEYLLNPTYLGNYLIKNKISTLFLTSQLFNQLVDINPYMFSNVKNLITGGEVLSIKHINKIMKANPNLQVIHAYGPTENTTFTTCFYINKKYSNDVPIGFPLSGTKCYITSKKGCLLPIGVPGELLVSGDGVSRGYINKDALTNESFINNPFERPKIKKSKKTQSVATYSRIYKTGDLVKWNKDGSISFIGRIDNQIKLRGFRIELSEINNTILKHPKVKDSYTIIQSINDSKEICAYIVPNENIDIPKLKEFLKISLPYYMIPSCFCIMEKFPMNINGKVDKNKLPIPKNTTSEADTFVAPKSTFELEIYKFIKDLSKLDNISINDNFFDSLGLDSLDAMKLCSLLYKYDISIQDISDYPTIKLLANKIEKDIKISHYENILPVVDIKNKQFSYNLKCVLLTGALGFLGMHILRELLLCDKVKKIYCLIRNKGNTQYTTRFTKTLNFYFDNTLDKQVNEKIELICGDFEDENLQLSEEEYTNLSKKITTVIHCGANVKHYGNFQKFNSSNVIGTQNIIDFCKKSNAKLAHISTLSVGGYKKPEENLYLSENDLNIGQTFNNHVYMITKYLAEYHVLSAIEHNQIKAKIFRMGNIMPRFSDNKFQLNAADNAMFCRLKTISKLGKIIKPYEELIIDLSPVDLCAKSIITILNNPKRQTIYHIYNNNILSIKDFFKLANIKTSYTNKETFIQDIQNLKDPLSYHILNDLKSKNLPVSSENNLTAKILKDNDFCWNKIDKKYIKNLKDFI